MSKIPLFVSRNAAPVKFEPVEGRHVLRIQDSNGVSIEVDGFAFWDYVGACFKARAVATLKEKATLDFLPETED